jgi:uncharacterized protein YndB with AHSA1/START domain
MTTTIVTVKAYQVFIKATPQAIWDAITKTEWTQKYGYQAPAEYDLRPGGKYQALATKPMLAHGAPRVVVDGEVVEADPPRKLVQTWRFLWSPELIAEGFTRVTWEIEEREGGLTKLTVTHDLQGAPLTMEHITGAKKDAGGGWSYVISDLKTLLETGKSFVTPVCDAEPQRAQSLQA